METKQQTDIKDVFNLLESPETHVTDDIKKYINESLSSGKHFSYNRTTERGEQL